MKFLHHVLQEEAADEVVQETLTTPETLAEALENRFKLPENMHVAILALALSQKPTNRTDFEHAVACIRRHMRSIGYFGPGFGAVIAKYANNAEISQVACRAQAVGGGTYLLGQGLRSIGNIANGTEHPDEPSELTQVVLSDGTAIRTRCVVGMADDLPRSSHLDPERSSRTQTIHSVSIVSSALPHLFQQTSENGPTPAAAIVLVEDQRDSTQPPIYLQIHSEDTGECPAGQCKLALLLPFAMPFP